MEYVVYGIYVYITHMYMVFGVYGVCMCVMKAA